MDSTRKLIVTSPLLVMAMMVYSPLPSRAAPAEQAPMNVLLLMVDDLNTWLLNDPNRYGGKVIAPHIRKLAQSGVNFSHSYAASPSCSPSRTALLSGMSPWKTGIYANGLDMEKSSVLADAVFLPDQLKSAGYSIASYGKISHGWGNRRGWDERFAHKRDPIPPDAPFTTVGRGEQDWGPIHLAEAEMNDTKYADAAIARIQQNHEHPFFIACGLFNPHMPWYVPQEYFDLYPLDEIVLPATKAGDLEDVPELGRQLTDGKRNFVDSVLANELHREAVQAYLATTTYADRQIGRVLEALESSPHRNNTIVILISDHGFHLGEKNHWQKMTLWEEATHNLMIWRVPGLTRPGSKSSRFVSLQDLYPTLMELTGVVPPDYLDGRSLLPLLQNPNTPWTSTAISAHHDRYISIRTAEYRYIRYSESQEELYDRRTDPHEWTNQINNPNYASALQALRTQVPPLSDMKPLVDRRTRAGQ
ncbi:MAG: sulfatase [Synoicihabitans sp.]